MKNNIILILVVTVISIAVIIISIAVSAGKNGGESSAPSGESKPAVTTQNTQPQSLETTSEPDPAPDQNTQPVQPATSEVSEPERFTDEQTAGNIISLARSLIGTSFVDGGDSPMEGFDNSGFIYFVLRENGYITCPRGVSAQAEMGAALEYSSLRPGDLVFFSEGGTSAEFGGIYAGDGVMIACLMPGTQVKEVNITTDYYSRTFYRGVAIS